MIANGRLLIIAYLFPPEGGPGTPRIAKFCKYLPQYGWQPIVLTVREDRYHQHDATLLADIAGIEVVARTGSFEPRRLQSGNACDTPRATPPKPAWLQHLHRWCSVPDSQNRWLPHALGRGVQLIRQHRPHVLFSTSYPYTDHLVAYLLQRWSGLPWVAEFRDPWTDNALYCPPSRLHCWLDNWLERRIVRRADRLVSVLADNVWRKWGIADEKVAVIGNGYDADDMVAIAYPAPADDRLTLAVAGSYYGTYGLRPLLDGMRQWLERKPDTARQSLLHVYGRADEENRHLLATAASELPVIYHGYVPNREVWQRVAEAHASVLVLPVSDAHARGWIPQKFYHYYALQRPLLALCGDSPLRVYLHEDDMAAALRPEAVAEALDALHARWRAGRLPQRIQRPPHDEFTRRARTRELAELFSEVARR